ncbi:MAG: CoA transferase [Clostridiaceae bacterium]|jgi:CoA:oxalate CoA-transferase|nr:CoA transferase [Clostridiaceae bacterium]
MDNTSVLNDIRILDLTRVLSGPFCTMLLADFGAEVIKVERPMLGDDSRHFGPFINGESSYFMSLNRNKKSITLNLKSEEGKAIFLKLVKSADVIVENFKAGIMDKLGLGYENLKQYNPNIIYAAITGFGYTGPFRGRAAYDGIIQAMSGIMSITGEKGGQPVRVGASISDMIAGVFCSYGIAAALLHRLKTGEGQFIDVSMLDCQIAFLENAIVKYLATGIIPSPQGTTHTSIFPFETFPTTDSTIMIAAGNDELWEKLCIAVEAIELSEDERFSTNPNRQKNHDEMYSLLCKKTVMKTTENWQQILNSYGIPCSPINTMDEVVKNPQVIARDMIIDIDHKTAGKIQIPGIPIKMSKTPGKINKSSPLLGENTKEILQEYVGLTCGRIEKLYFDGIV